MESYNLKNLQRALEEMSKDIKGQDIVTVAAAEQLDPATVRTYLKGKITTPAIGKAILERCRALLLKKQAA